MKEFDFNDPPNNIDWIGAYRKRKMEQLLARAREKVMAKWYEKQRQQRRDGEKRRPRTDAS